MQTSMIVQVALELWGAVFCLITASILFADRKNDRNGILILFSALLLESVQLVSDVLALLYRGKTVPFAFAAVRVSNLLVFLANHLLIAVFGLYINHVVKSNGGRLWRPWLYIIEGVNALGCVNLFVSQFTGHLYYFDSQNIYHRGALYPSIIALAVLSLVILALMIVLYRKTLGRSHFFALLAYIVLLSAATILQGVFYGFSLTNLANTVSILLIIAVYARLRSARRLAKERLYAHQQQDLTNTRVELMVSQIQPHFISNTLLTIQGLYHADTAKADEIMHSFIHYLQQNFSRLSAKTPISVQEELEYTKNYTDITCARWPDMEIVYEIADIDFSIPAMTVQPIVENAIRHGLMPLESGGKVIISTFETADNYCVKVADNGVGYDIAHPTPQYKDNRKHIGLQNIRSRLDILCGGTLEIESAIGTGTTVTVSIPKKEGKKK